ncbi:MAG: glycosyltransferase family 9 protein [Fidelibacterota bacterium]
MRFSSIGDIILTTPVLESLKWAHPDSEIHFLTLEPFSEILVGNPHVSRILRISRDTNAVGLRRLAHTLKESGYSAYVDCHNSLRSRVLRGYLRSHTWFVYRKPRLDRFLLFNLHINRFPRGYDAPSEYAKLFDHEIADRPPGRPRLYISSAEKRKSRRFLEDRGVAGEFIALIPGASWRTKEWLPSRYIELANGLVKDEGIPVVILGGPGDPICDEISRSVPDAVNLKGKTGLRESLAILACARAAIGSDTGLTHGAEAVDTPVVMLLGPTSRETGAWVRHPRSMAITTQPWCQPCSKNGSRPCYRKERICMRDIDPRRVFSSLKKVMAQA